MQYSGLLLKGIHFIFQHLGLNFDKKNTFVTQIHSLTPVELEIEIFHCLGSQKTFTQYTSHTALLRYWSIKHTNC